MEQHFSILLVDDDAVDRMAVRRALKAAGVPSTIEEAVDRGTALAALERSEIDVVLLDYRLPGTDGLTLLRELRERGITTPIVMLTGQGDEQLAVELLTAGATDYLVKGSVSPDVLAQSLHRAQRIATAERLAAEAEHALRLAAGRQQFLAEVSQSLVESLELSTTLNKLGQLLIRAFADACVIDMLAADGSLQRDLVIQNAQADCSGIQASGPDEPLIIDPNSLSSQVVQSLRPRLFTSLEDLPEGEAQLLELYLQAGAKTLICVPLMVRGQSIGAITLINCGKRPDYTTQDLKLAEDVAHRAAIAIDNARLYREAQDAVRVRDAFLSVAAHELKTPLTTLYGNVQLMQRRALREGNLNERDQRTLRIIFEQTARLNKMISALLDLSRLQMGQFTIQPALLDIAALSQRVVDELQPSLDRHTITLRGTDTPLLIMGDELRLDQVLQNLVQNAIKYSPEGGDITIEVGSAEPYAQIIIRDQGIGIPESSIPNLFRRFFRASNVHEHRISGIGVGLYVVNEIVQRHGGSILVESVEGSGTTFIIQLPLPQPEIQAA